MRDADKSWVGVFRTIWHRYKKFLPAASIMVGIDLIVLAIVADPILGGRQEGIGALQKTAVLVGTFFLGLGIFTASSAGKRAIEMIASPPERYRKPVSIMVLAIWFGLVTGYGEVFFQEFRKLVLGAPIPMNQHLLWMIPSGDGFLFLTVGLILFLVATRWSKLGSARLTTFVFLSLTITCWLPFFFRLHIVAAILLTVGLAYQLSGWIAKRPERLNLVVARTTGWMAGLVMIAGLGVFGGGYLIEQHQLAGLPQAAPDTPNVVLITMDTVRAEDLSLYGYRHETTPQLERWASKGVLFKRAISASSWTLPSHASMFTGRYPHELSTTWTTPLDQKDLTLAEELRGHGYETAGFVANLYYCDYNWGLNRGFIHYEDFPLSLGQIALSMSLTRTISNVSIIRSITGYFNLLNRKSAENINRDFFSWLSRRRGQRPFFAFINYFDAHFPYLPPAPYNTMFGSEAPRVDFNFPTGALYKPVFWMTSPSQIQAEREAYDGSIAYIDAQVGVLLDELQKRGLLENTVVIITSDHGEQFGEHNLFDHGNSLYMQTLWVPLVILYPSQISRGVVVDEPVDLRNLASTVVDILGLGDKDALPGESLAYLWTGEKTTSEIPLLSEVDGDFRENWYPASKGEMHSLVKGNLQYILEADGSEELFNYQQDPGETVNLSNTLGMQHEMQQLRTVMKALVPEANEKKASSNVVRH